jgi:hypothetical protein
MKKGIAMSGKESNEFIIRWEITMNEMSPVRNIYMIAIQAIEKAIGTRSASSKNITPKIKISCIASTPRRPV